MDTAPRTASVSSLPPSVNFHLWEPCNMRCRFCFATFQDVKQTVLPRGHLPREQALAVVEQLAAAGFDKITFAGGEPTLCPWIGELIECARQRGLTTMLVTNGSRLLVPGWLAQHGAALDWVVLSIDSADPRTHERLGRSIAGQPGRALTAEHYQAAAAALRARGVRLKVNTVVTALNAEEDLSELLLALRPERWKVLQVLPVEGQNDGKVEKLLIDERTFRRFCARHQRVADSGIELVPEDNEDMTGSYAMVDPAGRFFDNTAGHHSYSRTILDVGVAAAWQDTRFEARRFAERGGVYDWRPPSRDLVPLGRAR
jgi:radical S-adenosyl methionine domain-containing protein 2